MLTSESYEDQLGLQSWQEVRGEYKESQDPELNETLRRVGRNLAAVAEREDFSWEFILFESEQANAFCLPGGKVAVFSGILPYMLNEAELAAVMGHEIGHAIARHGGERLSQNILQSVGGVLILSAFDDEETAALAAGAYGIVSQYGVLLPYSRAHELEADLIGLRLMARAGYDPKAALSFWEKFGESSKGSSLEEFMSTHPLGENRLAALQEGLPEALKDYSKAKVQHGLGSALIPRR